MHNRTTPESQQGRLAETVRDVQSERDIYLDTHEGWYNVREEEDVRTTSGCQLPRPRQLQAPQEDEGGVLFLPPLPGTSSCSSSTSRRTRRSSSPRAGATRSPSRGPRGRAQDLSVSRTTFDWGIPVPDAPGHVMYVWFDALTNYLTGTGWLQKLNGDGMWPASVHIIGKDIIWFYLRDLAVHAVVRGLPLSKPPSSMDSATAAGWMGRRCPNRSATSSIPWISSPGTRPTRSGTTLRNAVYGSDVPFSESNLVYVHNSDLADLMGNLAPPPSTCATKTAAASFPTASRRRSSTSTSCACRASRAMSNLEVQRAASSPSTP